MGKLREVMALRWGMSVRPEFTPKTFAITATEQKILNDNPDRLSVLMINLGTEVCYIHTTREVSATNGIWLDKNGGGIEMPWDVYGELVGQEWWCEGDAATTLYVAPIVGA